MSFFSILVPVFNQVGKMDRCMESIRAQGFKDFEVIMVDDGSTDDSYQMLQDYASKDDRVRVVRHEKNASLAAARYTGMKEASGEVIIYLDSDDYLSDNALEVRHQRFTTTDADIVRFGFVYEPENRVEIPPEVDDIFKAVSESVIAPSVWKNAYRKSVTDELLAHTEPFYCNMGEDVYFTHILFTFGKKIDRIDDVLYHYQLDTGMSSKEAGMAFDIPKFKKAMSDVLAVTEHVMSFIHEFNPEHEEIAKRSMDNMQHNTLMQRVTDKDLKKIVGYLAVINEMGLDELYEFGCNRLLRSKVLSDEGKISREEAWAMLL